MNASDAYFTILERLRPHSYDETRYPGAFFAAATPQEYAAPAKLPRRLYTLWTGINPMSDNRRRGLDRRDDSTTESSCACDAADLDKHLISGHPLHPAYKHLSLVHRSDYLRCYLMHFRGGGYADVKTYHHDWTESWQQLGDLPEAWALGYTEVSSEMCAQLPGTLGRDLRRHYRALIGNGAYLIRPDTPLTQLWYDEVLRRMDLYAARLAAAPGDERGTNPDYPIPWTGLLGESSSRSACATPTA